MARGDRRAGWEKVQTGKKEGVLQFQSCPWTVRKGMETPLFRGQSQADNGVAAILFAEQFDAASGRYREKRRIITAG